MSLLQQLRVTSCADSQLINRLRNIKNLITGQEIRKIEYIRAGIVPILSDLFNKTFAVQSEDEKSGIWSECAYIVVIICNAGPPFVEPILRSEIPSHLVRCLNTFTSQKCTLALLRCLNSISDNLPLASATNWTADRTLVKLLQNAPTAQSLTALCTPLSGDVIEQQISDAALALICKTAQDARSKTLLVEAGLMDCLSRRLATFILAQGLATPQARSQLDACGFEAVKPAPHTAHLSPVLEVIALLIEDSPSLALDTFLSDPLLSKVLDWPQHLANPVQHGRFAWGGNTLSFQHTSHLDFLLPHIPETEMHRDSSFPPLGPPETTPKRFRSVVRTPRDAQYTEASDTSESDAERVTNPIIPYLMVVVRSSSGKRRCVAAHLLSILYSLGLVSASRAREMAALVIPILVGMLEKAYKGPMPSSNERTSTGYPCYWLAPFTLARLVRDNLILQLAAHDTKAITALAVALKANFDKVREKHTSLWWPQKLKMKTTEGLALHCLGLGGPTLEARHEMRFREGLLQALASIAPSNDVYRAAICEQGAMNQIILALAPFMSEVVPGKLEDSLSVRGNSAQTLLAACGAVRALTRSPTALRTKLVDAEVAKSVVKLLHYNEIEVRIAATAVLANLAHDFSPMKPTVSEPDIVRKLCEQAHSSHPRLRFESLFALKCLVTRSPNKLKKSILDGLGAEWIRHLLATDPRDVPSGDIIGLEEKHYRKGTNIRLQDDAEDIVMNNSGSIDLAGRNHNKPTLVDDFGAQEQLLGFVRNLFTGDNSNEIIEYFVTEVGFEELVHILIDRLKDRSRSNSYRKLTSSQTPPRGTIEHTMYILVHLSAADPKWKQLIFQQDALLKAVHGHFTSPDEDIRVACCWATINLLWVTSNEAPEATRHRAHVLSRRGFLEACNKLERADESLNVRERAKTAIHCFTKLIST